MNRDIHTDFRETFSKMAPQAVINRSELATLLATSVGAVSQMACRGELPGKAFPNTRRACWFVGDIRAWLGSNTKSADVVDTREIAQITGPVDKSLSGMDDRRTIQRAEPPHLADFFAAMQCEQNAKNALSKIRETGVAALLRLLPVAERDTGQSRRVARFVLGLYNGSQFPFDLLALRALDRNLFEDCLALLRLDFEADRQIHQYLENGDAIFEELAATWGFSHRERC